MNIVKSSLINYEELFLVPTLPKNPYTNLAFSYKNLYNIYHHCNNNHITIPKVFRYFYDSDFNLNKFIFHYEPIVRDFIILNYYKNMSFNQKYEIILTVVNNNRHTIPIIIHDAYPKEKVMTFLDCCILPYLKSEYSLNPAVKDLNKIKVYTILQTLYNQNKNFGKVYFNIKNNKFTPLDEPFTFNDPSLTIFNFNDNTPTNDNIHNDNNLFVFGTNTSNPPINYDTSDDMDIDSDPEDLIHIPPQSIVTYAHTIQDLNYSSITTSVYNPIVQDRHVNRIRDSSININSLKLLMHNYEFVKC